jgi:hypothetical protein
MRFKLVGNQRVSPNADVSPSQLCAVCQGKLKPLLFFNLFLLNIDSAQCQHYGVRTCEGKLCLSLFSLSLFFFFLYVIRMQRILQSKLNSNLFQSDKSIFYMEILFLFI